MVKRGARPKILRGAARCRSKMQHGLRCLAAPQPLVIRADICGEQVPGALALARADGRDSSRRAVARWALARRSFLADMRGERVPGELALRTRMAATRRHAGSMPPASRAVARWALSRRSVRGGEWRGGEIAALQRGAGGASSERMCFDLD